MLLKVSLRKRFVDQVRYAHGAAASAATSEWGDGVKVGVTKAIGRPTVRRSGSPSE